MSKRCKRNDNSEKIWSPFTRNLRFYMVDRGLLQEELAEMIGTGQTTVSAWLIGKQAPSMEFVYRIQEALNISFDDLMSDHSVPEIPDMQIYENHVRFYRSIFADDPNVMIPENCVSVCSKVLPSVLNSRDRVIVAERFGLNGGRPKRYAEVGERFGISRQRAEQIVSRCMKTLRKYKQYFTAPYGPVREDRIPYGGDRESRERCYAEVSRIIKEAEARLDAVFGVSEEQKEAVRELHTVPIEAADFDIRTYNCLKNRGTDTVGALLDVKDEELINTRGFGRVCLKKAQTKRDEILADPAGWLARFRKDSEKEDA